MTQPILPGATLGVLGGGQLGRMFALAARRMGYHTRVFAPGDDTPAGQIAHRETRAAYDDLDAVRTFAKSVSVVTFEFENVPFATTEAAEEFAPVRPAGSLLYTTQHRRREKEALRAAGIPVAPFARIETEEDLASGLAELGKPAILKTAAWGYDGRGQVRIDSPADGAAAWSSVERQPCVLEALVPFEHEISVLGARSVDGSVAVYEPVHNVHERHILDVSVFPTGLPERTNARARDIMRSLLETWEVVGLICVEMFVLPDGDLIVNEVAPRPHNSGHLTIDAHACSQFEQQVRAACALPLGSPEPVAPAAAMVNLLGDVWADGTPDWAAALARPRVALHLYGKIDARPGRKMGHLTATAATPETARAVALDARRALNPHGGTPEPGAPRGSATAHS